MKGLRFTLIVLLVAVVPLVVAAAPAAKPAPKDQKLPPGTTESGVINIEQLSKLQNLTILVKGEGDDAKKAVKVRTILPEGWVYTEAGHKKNSQELDSVIGWYTLTATPPLASKETDFVYELWVRSVGLTQGLDNFKDPKGNVINIPAKDRTEKSIFALYLNGMISGLNKLKYKTLTKVQSIKPVPYGVIPAEDGSSKMMLMGSRPEPMYYTPIKFRSSVDGSTLYTFSGVIGDKIISVRFLVAKDQEEFYEGTIALILNNTWGLTMDQDAQWAAEFAKRKAAAEAKQKGKGKTN